MKTIQSVLLDIDGTLIDSNEQHAHAWHDYLVDKGYKVPVGRLALMIGMGGDKLLAEVGRGRIDAKTAKRWSAERDELYLERYAPRVKPIPGATEFVGALAARGLRVALATSAREELIEAVFKLVPVERLIVGRTTASDVKRSKPDPEIFQTAIRKFGFDGPRTAVIGDTPYDIAAAKATPCRSIAVQTGHFPAYMLDAADEKWPSVQHLTRYMHRSMLAG